MFLVRAPHLRETSINERIDDTHAGVHEISTISRGDRQAVDGRRRCDEAILDRHSLPGCAKTRQQFRPAQAGVRVPGQTVEPADARVEPAFQCRPLSSPGKDQNPESQFAGNHRIDGDVRFMCPELRHDTRVG